MKHKKILPKHHTGKVVHHRHTSYASLLLMILMTIVPVLYASHSVVQAAATDPVTTSEQIYAVVPAQTPQTASIITNIAPGTVFTTNDPVTVSGTCPNNTLVKVYKNEVLAGAAFCNAGRFSLQIDLFLGVNTLITRTFNANNVEGPASAPLVVRHEIPGVAIPVGPVVTSGQLILTSDIFYKGISVGDTLSWPVALTGGQAPYAVSVGWGDGQTDLISRAEPGTFTIKHVYKEAGDGDKSSYNVTITATDQAGNKAFIQLVTIVSGDKPGVVGTLKKGYDLSGMIRLASQVIVGAFIVITAFWLGERREIWLMKHTPRRV